jgi:hypothetical protein
MTAQERAIVGVYKKTWPAVAELTVYHAINGTTDGNMQVEEIEEGAVNCSVSVVRGFLWDDQGQIVTSEHCIMERGKEGRSIGQ